MSPSSEDLHPQLLAVLAAIREAPDETARLTILRDFHEKTRRDKLDEIVRDLMETARPDLAQP
jgi:hypothetical protein